MTDTNGLPNRCPLPECAEKEAGLYGFDKPGGLKMHTQRVHLGVGPQKGSPRNRKNGPGIKTQGRKVVVQVEDPEPETMTFSSGAITFEVSNNYIPLTAPDGSTWLAFRVIEP